MPRKGVEPCTIFVTPLAGLDSTCQFLASSRLDNNVLPSLVKDFFNFNRDVDNLACWNNIVESMNITIIQLFVPETVFRFSQFVQLLYFTLMFDLTFSTESCKWTNIRVHGSKYLAGIVDLAAYVLRAIVPIEP
jgi:hypothetical protein